MKTKKLIVNVSEDRNSSANLGAGENDVLYDRLKHAVFGVVRSSINDTWVKMDSDGQDGATDEKTIIDAICKRLDQLKKDLKASKDKDDERYYTP